MSHAGAKRYSFRVVVNSTVNKTEVASIVRQLTNDGAKSIYHRNHLSQGRWGDSEAKVVWTFVYASANDYATGNPICRSLWVDPDLPEQHRPLALTRIHRWTGMDGVRTAEGGEGVTGAMIRARIWVDGRLAGGLQALLGAPMAAYSGCGERDGGIGHGKRRSRTGQARVCGDVGLAGGSVADGRRQAGNGMSRSWARARLNCSSQGQRRGRCRVNRRAERVIRPAKAKTRRLRVLVVTIC